MTTCSQIQYWTLCMDSLASVLYVDVPPNPQLAELKTVKSDRRELIM